MPGRLTTLTLFMLCLATAFGVEQLSERLPARRGEICQVCNGRVQESDAAYLVGGQRVALHAAGCCEGEFLRRPHVYAASLRPNSILFSGEANLGLASRWIWIGLYVLAGILFGGLCAHLAVRKGLSPLPWYLWGFLFSAAAFLYLNRKRVVPGAAGVPAGLAKVPLTREPVACPACGHANHPSARRCLGCGGHLEPLAPSEVSAVGLP